VDTLLLALDLDDTFVFALSGATDRAKSRLDWNPVFRRGQLAPA
jgi:hypothetical protein